MSHRGHEGTLHTDTVLCTFRRLCQLPTGVGYPGDIGGDALMSCNLTVLVDNGIEGDIEDRARLSLGGLDEMDDP